MTSGMLTEVTVLNRGSAATATAAIGGSVVTVEDVTQFDDTGRLDICGIQYDYLNVDRDALTITLATTLTVAVDIYDPVSVVAGDEVAKIYSAVIDLGMGDNVTVPIPLELRPLLAEGQYDPPVPIGISPDLQSIVDVPGRVPVIQNTTLRTADSGPRWELTGSTDNQFVTDQIFGYIGDPAEQSPATLRTTLIGTRRELQIYSGNTASFPGSNVGKVVLSSDSVNGSGAALVADLLQLAGAIKLGDGNVTLRGLAFGAGSVTFPGGAGSSVATTGNIAHGLTVAGNPATPLYVGVMPNAATSRYFGYIAGGMTSTQFNLGLRDIVGVTVGTTVNFLWFAIC